MPLPTRFVLHLFFMLVIGAVAPTLAGRCHRRPLRHRPSSLVAVATTPAPPPAASPTAIEISSSSSALPTSSESVTTPQAQVSAPPPAPEKTPAPAVLPSTPEPDQAAGGPPLSDIDAYLAVHNVVRQQHGASPLSWSDDLAQKAQQWANGCQFKHSGGVLGRFGENLAAGTSADYNIQAAIKSWTDEVSDYDPNNPIPSHFTQVVWKGTTQLGCAVQLCDGIFPSQFGKARYYVCEYSPPGNVITQFQANVQV